MTRCQLWSHVSSAWWPCVAGGCHFGWCRCRPCLALESSVKQCWSTKCVGVVLCQYVPNFFFYRSPKFHITHHYHFSHIIAYNSGVLSAAMMSCNHCHCLVPEHSLTPKGNLIPIKQSLAIPPCSSPWQLLIYFLSLWVYLLWMFRTDGTLWYVTDFFPLAWCFWGPPVL